MVKIRHSFEDIREQSLRNRHSFKDIKRGVFRLFSQEGLTILRLFRGGGRPKLPRKEYISLVRKMKILVS